MNALKWTENHGEFEAYRQGHWGFVVPDPPNWYRAYDGRFARTEFGTGFLGLFATFDQATRAIEEAWGTEVGRSLQPYPTPQNAPACED